MKYWILLILLLFYACIREHEDTLSTRQNRTITILPQWGNNIVMTDGLRLTLYSNETKKYIQDNIPPEGGEIGIRVGVYRMIVYTNDSEKILYKNIRTYETYEASTNKVYRPSYVNPVDEETYEQPDKLWIGTYDNLIVCRPNTTICIAPHNAIKEYYAEIEVEGLEAAQAVRGATTGMLTRYLLHSEESAGESGTIAFDAVLQGDRIFFSFKTFGIYKGVEGIKKHYLTLEFLLNNGIARQKMDITDILEAIPNGGKIHITKKLLFLLNRMTQMEGLIQT